MITAFAEYTYVLLYHFHLKLLTFSKVQSRISSEYIRAKIGPSFSANPFMWNTSFQFQHYYDLDTELTYSCFPGYKQTDGFAGAQCFFFNGTARWFGPGLLNNSIQLVCFYLTADKTRCSNLDWVTWPEALEATHDARLRALEGRRGISKRPFIGPRPEKRLRGTNPLSSPMRGKLILPGWFTLQANQW